MWMLPAEKGVSYIVFHMFYWMYKWVLYRTEILNVSRTLFFWNTDSCDVSRVWCNVTDLWHGCDVSRLLCNVWRCADVVGTCKILEHSQHTLSPLLLCLATSSVMDRERYNCSHCKKLFTLRHITGCIVCRTHVCDECLNLTGKWVHPRSACDYCIDRTGDVHDCYYVCKRKCERILLHVLR